MATEEKAKAKAAENGDPQGEKEQVSQAMESKDAAAEATESLGIEVGGHALPALLPRTLFAAHPEYFPVGPDGHRTDLGNVCPSSTA